MSPFNNEVSPLPPKKEKGKEVTTVFESGF